MTTTADDDAFLKKECRHLYSCFFKRMAPERLVRDYVRAHMELASLRECPAEEAATLEKIVEKGLNAAAIEPWLRRKGNRHALTRKLMLIAYLAESGGGHEEFSRQPLGRLGGWPALILAGVRGAAGMALGYAEKTFYGLV